MLQVDRNTLCLTRTHAARVCIQLDVSKDLPRRVWIGFGAGGGAWQPLMFPAPPFFCSSCKRLGHLPPKCKKKGAGPAAPAAGADSPDFHPPVGDLVPARPAAPPRPKQSWRPVAASSTACSSSAPAAPVATNAAPAPAATCDPVHIPAVGIDIPAAVCSLGGAGVDTPPILGGSAAGASGPFRPSQMAVSAPLGVHDVPNAADGVDTPAGSASGGVKALVSEGSAPLFLSVDAPDAVGSGGVDAPAADSEGVDPSTPSVDVMSAAGPPDVAASVVAVSGGVAAPAIGSVLLSRAQDRLACFAALRATRDELNAHPIFSRPGFSSRAPSSTTAAALAPSPPVVQPCDASQTPAIPCQAVGGVGPSIGPPALTPQQDGHPSNCAPSEMDDSVDEQVTENDAPFQLVCRNKRKNRRRPKHLELYDVRV